MIETPTWVMNAIAPSSAIAGERPRPHALTRSPIHARAAVTWPSCGRPRYANGSRASIPSNRRKSRSRV